MGRVSLYLTLIQDALPHGGGGGGVYMGFTCSSLEILALHLAVIRWDWTTTQRSHLQGVLFPSQREGVAIDDKGHVGKTVNLGAVKDPLQANKQHSNHKCSN